MVAGGRAVPFDDTAPTRGMTPLFDDTNDNSGRRRERGIQNKRAMSFNGAWRVLVCSNRLFS